MSQRAAVWRRRSASFWWAVGTAAVALALARIAVARPVVAVLAVVAPVAAWLVLRGELRLLVLLTSLGLVLGSSTLPFTESSAFFWGKFVLMGLVGATAITRTAMGRNSAPLSRAYALSFLTVVVLASISTLYSVAPDETRLHALSLLVLWLATALAVAGGVWGREDLIRLMKDLGVVAAFSVLAGFLLVPLGIVPTGVVGRFQGIFGNPNTLGYFVAPILPALILLMIQGSSKRDRALDLAIVIVLVGGLALSGSRGGLLATAFGVAVGLAASRRKLKAMAAVLAVSGVVAGVVVVMDRPIRPTGEALLEVGTGSGRLEAWQDSIPLINKRPLTGHGFATTAVFFREARGADPTELGSQLTRLHNSYLEAGLDLGWPGSALLAMLALSGVWAAWRVTRRGGASGALGAALLAGIAGGIMEGVFETGLLAAGGLLAFHFWLVVGAAHALRVRHGRTSAAEASA